VKEGRVLLGVVVAPHGVRGAVRIKTFTARPRDIGRYGPLEDETGERRFEVVLGGEGKGVVEARLSGVADRAEAEALRGQKLYLPRSALPEPAAEEYYHADLIGLDAMFRDGRAVGRVQAVYDFGAGEMLEIARGGLPPLLVPFTRAVVPIVDLEGRRVVLEAAPGLFEEEEKKERA
jgi:16S rRNA processing protein RimM